MFETKGLESLESALARVVDDVAAANNTKHEDASETVSLTVGDSASLSTPEPPRFGCAGHTTTNNNKSTPRFTFCLSAEDEKVLRSVMTIIGDYDSLVEKDTTKSFIPMLEARGGTDKDPVTGHRRDSVPIANAIDQEGSHTAVFSYLEDSECPEAVHSNNLLRQHLLSCATGVVVRVNPGTLSPTSQKNLDMMLTELGSAGIAIMSSPVVQKMMGAKDALFKIRELDCGMVDTYVYYDAPNFSVGFRKSIAQGPRVIKQNRGSQGEGIWIIKLEDESQYGVESIVELDTKIVLIEANDNHVEHHTVQEFLEFAINGRSEAAGVWKSTGTGRYLEGGIDAGAMLVDQRFLPRIVEGEVRCLMVGDKLVSLVHKVPQAGTLSATLQSGAKYSSYEPDDPKFAKLVGHFFSDLPKIMNCFGLSNEPLPLLWTADFIFGDQVDGQDETFYIGEFNCSCVGITQQLELAPVVAKTVIETCKASSSV